MNNTNLTHSPPPLQQLTALVGDFSSEPFVTAEQASVALNMPLPASTVATSKVKVPAVDELGPATAKWDYQDASGKLIAVVYRYDPEPGRKEFRPWDVRRRKMAPPEPRPLYNQPDMLKSEQVVLVEGEKCAQALIDLGVCATTAMHGANAPVDKTDWTPLKGKRVLIWPDRDKPGWNYADQASQAVMAAGAVSCAMLQPPAEKPEGWDAADAVRDGFDITGFLAVGERVPVVRQMATIGRIESTVSELG